MHGIKYNKVLENIEIIASIKLYYDFHCVYLIYKFPCKTFSFLNLFLFLKSASFESRRF